MGLPAYPATILAKETYKERIDSDQLDGDSNLVRRSLLLENETFDNVGDVSLNALFRPNNEKDLYDWSTNLLGIYEPSHLNFVVKKDPIFQKGATQCLRSSDDVLNYEYKENSTPIYIRLNLLHKSKFPYKKEDLEYSGIICVEHVPTICNYWHFQVKINEANGSKINIKTASTWKVDAAKYFYKSRLKKFCKPKPSPPDPPVITESIFIQNE